MAIEILAPMATAGALALSGGGTGLISVPDAGTLPSNSFLYQRSNGIFPHASGKIPAVERSVNDQIQLSLFPRLEFGARLTTWYGPVPDRSPSRYLENDLSMHVKWTVYNGENLRIAIGARDIAGQGGAQKLAPVQFGVIDWNSLRWKISLGVGVGDDETAALNGVFGGLVWRPRRWLDVIADHDGVEGQAGFRLHADAGSASVFIQAAYSSHEINKGLFAAGLRLPLGQDQRLNRREPRGPFKLAQDSEPRYHLETDFSNQTWGGDYVAAQMAAGLSASSRCGITKGVLSAGLGIMQLDCSTGDYAARWNPRHVNWRRLHLQTRLGPALRYAIGTEIGRMDYSLAARASAQLQLPAGFSTYASWDTPLTASDDYKEGGPLESGRHESGLQEFGAQLNLHLLSGWFMQIGGGKTTFGEQKVAFNRVETALLPWGGRIGLNFSATRFDLAGAKGPVAEHQMLGKVFAWVVPARYAIQMTGGDFLYGDSGQRLDLFSYFGRTRVGIYLKNGDGMRAAGMSLSIPLGGKKPLQTRRASINGVPHFQASLESLVSAPDGLNTLRPNLLQEFSPQRDLIDDVLDQWRMSPSYVRHR